MLNQRTFKTFYFMIKTYASLLLFWFVCVQSDTLPLSWFPPLPSNWNKMWPNTNPCVKYEPRHQKQNNVIVFEFWTHKHPPLYAPDSYSHWEMATAAIWGRQTHIPAGRPRGFHGRGKADGSNTELLIWPSFTVSHVYFLVVYECRVRTRVCLCETLFMHASWSWMHNEWYVHSEPMKESKQFKQTQLNLKNF